jgi:hypothetical protein
MALAAILVIKSLTTGIAAFAETKVRCTARDSKIPTPTPRQRHPRGVPGASGGAGTVRGRDERRRAIAHALHSAEYLCAGLVKPVELND